MRLSRTLLLIYPAAFLRSLGVGLLGVVLGVYLFRIGLDSTRIGLVLAVGLAGGTVATAVVGFRGDLIGRPAGLGAAGPALGRGRRGTGHGSPIRAAVGAEFRGHGQRYGDRPQCRLRPGTAIIPGLVSDQQRTWALSWYNVLLDAGGALGALAGALPLALQSWTGVSLSVAYQYIFFSYAALQLLTAVLYLQLSPEAEAANGSLPDTPGTAVSISRESKSIVRRLAALFSVDSLGGGFLGDALVAFWFFRRFGIDEKQLGLLFFAVHLLNASSHLGAAWLSKRIGLLNTMVFTHLPSSLFLIAAGCAPNPTLAVFFFLLRESLVEMDVPTRQSYVAAVVKPHERTYASGMTNLTRTISWAAASSVAGTLMQNFTLSAPLILGGSLKIAVRFSALSRLSEVAAARGKIKAFRIWDFGIGI